jgi:hypothetical protein
MMYYYIVMDYNGWNVFGSEDIPSNNMIDYPYMTTCKDNANGILDKLKARGKNYYKF